MLCTDRKQPSLVGLSQYAPPNLARRRRSAANIAGPRPAGGDHQIQFAKGFFLCNLVLGALYRHCNRFYPMAWFTRRLKFSAGVMATVVGARFYVAYIASDDDQVDGGLPAGATTHDSGSEAALETKTFEAIFEGKCPSSVCRVGGSGTVDEWLHHPDSHSSRRLGDLGNDARDASAAVMACS